MAPSRGDKRVGPPCCAASAGKAWKELGQDLKKDSSQPSDDTIAQVNRLFPEEWRHIATALMRTWGLGDDLASGETDDFAEDVGGLLVKVCENELRNLPSYRQARSGFR